MRKKFASKSWMLLCLIVTKPAFLQLRAWVTLNFWSQGSLRVGYVVVCCNAGASASQNSPMVKVKPWFSSGYTFSQHDASFCFACWTALFCSGIKIF